MSELKYPSLWTLATNYVDETVIKGCYRSKADAEAVAPHVECVSAIVPYVSMPDHDVIVRAAVAAERERCAGIATFCCVEYANPGDDGWTMAHTIIEKIREVPT